MRSIYISVLLIIWSVKCHAESSVSSTAVSPTDASSTTESTTTVPPTTVSLTTPPSTTVSATTESSTTESSTTVSPTPVSPTTVSPVTESTTTVSPTTVSQTTESSTTVSPTIELSITLSPTTVTPTTESSTTESSTTVSPTTVSTTTISPTTVSPTTESSTTVTPTIESSTTVLPTTVSTTIISPTTVSPTTESSTIVSLTTESSTTVSPTTISPTTVLQPTESPTTVSLETVSLTSVSPTMVLPSTTVTISETTTFGPSTSESSSSIQTTKPATSSTINIKEKYVINTDNAVLTVLINVTFSNNCFLKDEAQKAISEALLKQDIMVTNIIPEACYQKVTRGERSIKRIRSVIIKTNVRARDFIGNSSDAMLAINETICKAFNETVEVQGDDVSGLTMCDTDICLQESLKYKGFECHSTNDALSNCTFQSACFGYDCGTYGFCQIKANGMSYAKFCSCQEEDMYKYVVSADKCVKGDLSYKAWMIIAAGAGGFIVLIFLFAIVIQCARRKREPSNPEKYSDRETLMYDRSYDHIDQYHRKPSLKVEDRRIQTSLQTFDNQGYDHWDPDESKETYQSMDRHFQSPNFQTQITRPKLTTNRYGEDKLTPF